ncbi:uncharacterized protein N7496_012507 [Penicillium cataractarum]|uniref:BTB domain-containing protein n=1 Tax=Penicillium cataractarum TaxID=2100454 RepID=A0A9W9R7U3_9EURO|nr:uncharacterized protein N7496_012507 [Penicillium cataractarum]KAJ5355295.1 hypothetical protein N7496_012507 [Penicillium cataractarum]
MPNSPQPSPPSQAVQAPPILPPILRLKSRDFADTFEHFPTNSIIHSPSFTFLVGPKHTKLTIQSGLAQHVSKPLHNLMNNGHTRESKHRIAVLEDEDVETFVAFCEYAYTGDYKVPQLPVPVPAPALAPSPRENTRVEVVESVMSPGQSWRGTYRSDSVSSAVPPPAPSPPPGSQTDGQTVRAEGDVPPVVEEDVSAETEAEEPAEAEAGPKVEAEAEAEAEAVEPEAQEPASTEQAQESPGTQEPVEPAEPLEQPKETDWAQYQPADEASWEEEPAYPTSKKSKKAKAKAKKAKKKSTQQPLEDEPPASLTPPSTPPPPEPEVVEIQPEPEPVPEPAPEPSPEAEPEPVAVEDEAVGADEDAWEEDAPAEVEEEAAPEPPASPLPSPMPSPSAAPTDAPEWLQPTSYPPQENDNPPAPMSSMSPRTTSRTNSPTINAPPSPKPIIDMSFAKQSDSSPRTPGLSLWDEFAALQYNDDSAVPSTPKPSTSRTTTSTDLPYLTFHAKVYVFATRYLIPALAQLCLRKLHTDLVHLPLGDDTSEEYGESDADANPPIRPGLPGAPAIVLDVLRYAYTKTTRLEPISPTSATQLRENELRRLVVHYAACRVKELARWHGGSGSGSATPAVRGVGVDGTRPDSLRALLDGTPELASDLVYRMM